MENILSYTLMMIASAYGHVDMRRIKYNYGFKETTR